MLLWFLLYILYKLFINILYIFVIMEKPLMKLHINEFLVSLIEKN